MKSRRRGMTWDYFPLNLQKLGYEFSFDQKTWKDFLPKRTNFSIFGQGNPYHQPTYRFPPLHPISAPDAPNRCFCFSLWLYQKTQNTFWNISSLRGFDQIPKKTQAKLNDSFFQFRPLINDFGLFKIRVDAGHFRKIRFLIRLDSWVFVWNPLFEPMGFARNH